MGFLERLRLAFKLINALNELYESPKGRELLRDVDKLKQAILDIIS